MSRRRGERGATLLLFALCLVFLLTLVAFAVDLGQGRFASRDNQQAADLAAISAGYYLAGHGTVPASTQPRAACESALSSLSTNLDGYTPTSAQISTACAAFPVDASVCEVAVPPTITASLDLGEYRVTVEWPLSTDQISDDRYDGVGVQDGDDDCERMRISVNRTQDTAFARVIGVNTVASSGEAVVRGGPSLDNEGVAALLMLEREGCGTLQRSGQGKVVVKTVTDPTSGEERPGVIQSDSAGSTTAYPSGLECRTSGNPPSPQDNASGYAIYASCTGTNLPGIVAEPTPGGEPGIISTYAKQVGSNHGAHCYNSSGSTGLNVEPIGGPITSRKPADDRFNPTVRPAITDLHSAAYSATVTNGAATSGTVLNGNANCSHNADKDFTEAGHLTLACGNGGFSVNNNRRVSFPNATSIKFIGGVSVGGGGRLDVPNATTVVISRWNGTNSASSNTGRLVVAGTASFGKARNIYVGGQPSTCSPVNQCSAVDVSGTLRVNTGGIDTASCVLGPGAGGPNTPPGNNWTQLATVGGFVNVSGSVSWCQTFVYVGGSQSTYTANQRTSGGLNCSPSLPCPVISTSPGFARFTLNGGSSSIIWSAPNQTVTDPDGTNPFEGLALWAEGTGTSNIKGTGTLVTTGVFFLPNATFEFDGQAAAANPFNAQFFTRTLNFSGQGDLNLAPNPRDSVKTAVPGNYALIR